MDKERIAIAASVGRTIAKATPDGEGSLWLEFTDGTYAWLEGSGDYDGGKYIEDVKGELYPIHQLLLGWITEAEYGAWRDKVGAR